MLEVRNLSVRYGGIEAVQGASLDVHAGETVALVGANGAGKSSIMGAIAGLVMPDAGSIRFNGSDITGQPSHRIMASGIALCPEGRMILGGLTIRENLLLATPGSGDFSELFEHFPVLADRLDDLAAGLSGGEAQMLAVARALARKPKLLLLDEPSLGLSPRVTEEIFALLPRLKADRLTILLIEQNVRQALRIADRAFVLESGRIALEGQATDVLNDQRIARAYLGITAEEST